ncbi:hypothetical protein B7Y92_03440 [Candidatus Saccharibacteria bacterium 32-50-13]|nr:MAG: hypothetical protein B7Y92_03440 [Candidatus Saccharibacteria bacterium 32-50-13]
MLGGLALVYGILVALFVGIGPQATYQTLVDTIQETGSSLFEGGWGKIGEAGLLYLSVASSGLTGSLTPEQQIYAVMLGLMTWLTAVWLLRQRLAGHQVKLRDGLYSAGSPIVALLLLTLLLVLQLLPVALAAIAYVAGETTGLLSGGVEAMLLWAAIALLATLSLYWATSTLLAMIIVTVPGTYPMKALRVASDMAQGRRLRLLLRIVWLLGTVVIGSLIILLPFILFDMALKALIPALSWLPVVPVVLLIVPVVSLIWVSTYVYMLYRGVIEDDATSR